MKLYHYTNLAAAIGIIQEKRSLEFWGSRYDCMNDPFDSQFAQNRIEPVIRNSARNNKLQKIETKELKVHPFIVSFSEKADDFLMWRLYNAKVCLVLDSEYFDRQTLNHALRKCEYISDNNEELHRAYHAISENLMFCPNIYAFSGRISTFIKHAAFKDEGEVRLATWNYYDEKDNTVSIEKVYTNRRKDDDGIVKDKKFQTRIGANGKITIYKKFHINGNALAGIIVHSYSEIEFEAIKEQLRSILICK